MLILFLLILIFAIRLIIKGNVWVCSNGDWIKQGNPNSEKPKGYCVEGQVDNFKECVSAGNPILESYPRKCINENKTYIEVIENFCLNKDTEDLCMTLYDPVCGYPLEKTFSNSCFACQNKEIVYWMPGECQ